ncbi:MAG: TonB-dependent receptor [Paludibacteraceae bacterium]|nr:TonB-dependent receptor [Paludibacteraceae bacterium]
MISILLGAMISMAAPSDTVVTLEDVTVSASKSVEPQMRSSQTSVHVDQEYLQLNFSGSLMQTMEGIPGVKAISIGSGQSKPTIRGLGYNRMVVSENGIKHEGQQWGDDHGLEIDQFSVDRAEVIKGPSALLYGSDAIGGVLLLRSNQMPKDSVEGSVQLFGRTNNGQVGASAKIGLRGERWYCRANVTWIDYADYKVPTDSIQYYSYWIRLKDGRLRNTAGCERNGSFLLGYSGRKVRTSLRLSDSYAKSGFFANAHGLEVRLSNIDYDHSRRDVDLPYQWVNHFKAHSHTSWYCGRTSMEVNLAYQNNYREECSEPVSHGYMPKPDNSLERRFNKSTYTYNYQARYHLGKHAFHGGLDGEYQYNRRGGWGFIIPDFETNSLGMFLLDRFKFRKNLIFNAGARLDFAKTHIHGYQDWYPTSVGSEMVCLERSADLTRKFHNLSWSFGANYNVGQWVIKANAGSGFRMPIPKELGANGINYHIFRYERGNVQLDPEKSYQLDLGLSWSNDALVVQVDPYLNYFSNYIYLSPTSRYVEGLQLYNYTQARVLRLGWEAQMIYTFAKHWEALLQGEYLHARQKSGEKKGYTLPFTPPWSMDAGLTYKYNWKGDGFVGLKAHVVGRQDEIVPPEKPTDGYWTLNFSAGKSFPLRRSKLNVSLHADNLLNRRYYNHTSYYRLIDVPEPGRNLSMKVGLDF